MVPIMSLWLPIIVSAAFVFVVSSVIHMAFKYHNKDFGKLANEDKVLDALRELNIPPGEYLLPKADSMAEMRSAEYNSKLEKGPGVIMTIWPGAKPTMTKPMVQWFFYSVIIGIFAAYVTGRALPVGASYLEVFRFAGFTAFVCYCVANWQATIWWRQSWRRLITGTIDALIYGLVTAGVFGWLWPR